MAGELKEKVMWIAFAASVGYLAGGVINEYRFNAQLSDRKDEITCLDPKIQRLTCLLPWLGKSGVELIRETINKEDNRPWKCTPYLNLGCAEYFFIKKE